MRWKGLACNGVELRAEMMVFRCKRSRNLQTLTADAQFYRSRWGWSLKDY
jgi:hypothetical protein